MYRLAKFKFYAIYRATVCRRDNFVSVPLRRFDVYFDNLRLRENLRRKGFAQTAENAFAGCNLEFHTSELI